MIRSTSSGKLPFANLLFDPYPLLKGKSSMIRRTFAAIALSCLLLGATRSEANYAVNGFVPTSVGPSQDFFTLGYNFTLNQTVTVTGLSIYDSRGSAGLADTHQVGIFRTGDALVAGTATTVGPGSTLFTTPGPNPQVFAGTTLAAPITLGPGSYFIGATYGPNSLDLLALTTAVTNFDPAVTYVEAGFARGATLANQTNNVFSPQGYIGPNFTFTAVPEPSSIILVGLGAAGLLVGRFARRKSVVA